MLRSESVAEGLGIDVGVVEPRSPEPDKKLVHLLELVWFGGGAFVFIVIATIVRNHFTVDAALCNATTSFGRLSTSQTLNCGLDTTLYTLALWVRIVGIVGVCLAAAGFLLEWYPTRTSAPAGATLATVARSTPTSRSAGGANTAMAAARSPSTATAAEPLYTGILTVKTTKPPSVILKRLRDRMPFPHETTEGKTDRWIIGLRSAPSWAELRAERRAAQSSSVLYGSAGTAQGVTSLRVAIHLVRHNDAVDKSTTQDARSFVKHFITIVKEADQNASWTGAGELVSMDE